MKTILLTSIWLVTSLFALAQPFPNDFQKVVGLPNTNIKNYTICKTDDGGYVVAAAISDLAGGANQNNILVFKTDQDFNLLWQWATQLSVQSSAAIFQPYDIALGKKGGFIVAGRMVVEGQSSGGFLLHLKPSLASGVDFNWMQIYPENGPAPVSVLTKVVQTDIGYMALGQSPLASVKEGIVLRTDFGGNVVNCRHLYDSQHGHSLSTLNDMVKVSPSEVAIVGTVNSYPADDADILVVKMNSNGDILNERVYEQANKVTGDKNPAYLERGGGITYNPNRDVLLVAGTTTIKKEGACVEADYRGLITLEINYADLALNWVTTHEIFVNLLMANDAIYCNDVEYNQHTDEYALTGTVLNDMFNPTLNYNGYILRTNADGLSMDLRYYGDKLDDFMEKMVVSDNGNFVVGGTANQNGKNNVWLVENYAAIDQECHELIFPPNTLNYDMWEKEGKEASKQVINVAENTISWLPQLDELILCDIDPVMKNQVAGIITADEINVLRVYPTLVEDGQLMIINSDDSISQYEIFSTDGKLISRGKVAIGTNEIEVGYLPIGTYFLRAGKENFKFVLR